MEMELGAPMFPAIVVKKIVDSYTVELHVRYRKRYITGKKRKVFRVVVHRGENNSEYHLERYLLAKKLKPGDELYVDVYGDDWSDPAYLNVFRRWWNLRFA